MQSTGDKLAKYFNKKYGDILYSGTLAIEAALLASGIKHGDYVVLPNNICYRVLLSVLRSGARPIIVNPKNSLILTKEDIKPLVKKYHVKAVILVHNFGIPANIKEIKDILPKKTVIIEDASQAWKVKYSGYSIGGHSDFVVTSFGKTKPLGFGIGGAIFSDDSNFRRVLDYNNRFSRLNADAFLPFVFPEIGLIDVKKIVAIGNSNFKKINQNVKYLIQVLNSPEIDIWKLENGDIASWHRLPIRAKSDKIYGKIITSAVRNNIKFDKPRKIQMSEIPLAVMHKCIIEGKVNNPKYQLYLYTDNKLGDIKKWQKSLKEK